MLYEEYKNIIELTNNLQQSQSEYKPLFEVFAKEMHKLFYELPRNQIPFIKRDREGFFVTNQKIKQEKLNSLSLFYISLIKTDFKNKEYTYRLMKKPFQFNKVEEPKNSFQKTHVLNFDVLLNNSLLSLFRKINRNTPISIMLEMLLSEEEITYTNQRYFLKSQIPSVNEFLIYGNTYQQKLEYRIYNIKHYILNLEYFELCQKDYLALSKLLKER